MSIDSGSVQIMILLTFMNVAFDAHVLMRMCMFDPRLEEGGRICRADARLSLAPATGQHPVISNKATESLLFPGISKSTPFSVEFCEDRQTKIISFFSQAGEGIWLETVVQQRREKETQIHRRRYLSLSNPHFFC